MHILRKPRLLRPLRQQRQRSRRRKKTRQKRRPRRRTRTQSSKTGSLLRMPVARQLTQCNRYHHLGGVAHFGCIVSAIAFHCTGKQAYVVQHCKPADVPNAWISRLSLQSGPYTESCSDQVHYLRLILRYFVSLHSFIIFCVNFLPHRESMHYGLPCTEKQGAVPGQGGGADHCPFCFFCRLLGFFRVGTHLCSVSLFCPVCN